MTADTKAEHFIRSRLNPRQMALLVQLDEQRSVLKAAEAMAMTQPAASKLLRDFEIALDVQLFVRHARGIEPTPFGEILTRRARAILSEIGLAQEEIAALKRGLSGQVSIGTVISPGTSLVPKAIKLVKERCPGLLVSVEIDHSKGLVGRLLKGDVDIVVGRILDSHGADELAFESLAHERHVVVARSKHPLAGRPNLVLRDLMQQTWILPEPGSVVRDRLAGVFAEHGVPMPTSVVQTGATVVVTNLLMISDMVATLPMSAVRPYCNSGILTLLIEDLGVDIGPFGIVTRRGRELSPGAAVMLAGLRDTARDLYAVKRRA
jgi:DNA-binding transcriptional LysR family regulator